MSFANENSSEETDDWNSTGTTASSSTSGSSSDVDWLKYFTVVASWIMFVIATFGNVMVLTVLLWRRSRSQVGTQLFVGSLAVADLSMMLTTVWMEAYKEIHGWVFGLIPCKLQYFCQWLTSNCSIWTLAALSIDRYLHAFKYFF